MKKVLASMFIFILVFSLAACGGSSDSGAGTNTSAYTADNPLTFIVAHVEAPDSFLHQSVIKWKEYVEEESGGSVIIDVHPNGELGGDDQVLEAIRMQTIHMTIASSSTLSTYDERLGLLDLPFVYESVEKMDQAIRGGLGELYAQWMDEAGFYCMGFQFDGSRGLSNNVRPVNMPADMNGLKVRVMQNDMYINIFNALGANPTPMSFSELYSALQQGTVDGQDNSPMLTYENKFGEVQKYYSTLGHTIANAAIITDKGFMEALPTDIFDLLKEGADQYLVEWQREQALGAENNYIQQLQEQGVEVIVIEDKTPFVDAVQTVYDEYRNRLGDEIIDQVISLARGE